jgi:hypothetical protein
VEIEDAGPETGFLSRLRNIFRRKKGENSGGGNLRGPKLRE